MHLQVPTREQFFRKYWWALILSTLLAGGGFYAFWWQWKNPDIVVGFLGDKFWLPTLTVIPLIVGLVLTVAVGALASISFQRENPYLRQEADHQLANALHAAYRLPYSAELAADLRKGVSNKGLNATPERLSGAVVAHLVDGKAYTLQMVAYGNRWVLIDKDTSQEFTPVNVPA